MKKFKIIIFGVTDKILDVLRDTIDPRKCEIIAFVDNDEAKHGKKCKGGYVKRLSEVEADSEMDYFVVTALSSYQKIKQQLIQYGVAETKIKCFVTKRLCEFNVGEIDDSIENYIEGIYFEPDKMMKIVQEYKTLYQKYQAAPQVKKSLSKNVLLGKTLISHACGGVVNGKKIMYSNSEEAFRYSVDNDFTLIECDIMMVQNELMLAHDLYRFYEAEEENYTMMTARDFIVKVKELPVMRCLIDIKWDTHDEYQQAVEMIEGIILDVSETSEQYDALKQRVIMEVYDEETIKIANSKSFGMAFTQYRNDVWPQFMKTACLCGKYGIDIVMLAAECISTYQKRLEIFYEKNISIFVFSTDDINEYHHFRKVGISGIITNCLAEKDIV